MARDIRNLCKLLLDFLCPLCYPSLMNPQDFTIAGTESLKIKMARRPERCFGNGCLNLAGRTLRVSSGLLNPFDVTAVTIVCILNLINFYIVIIDYPWWICQEKFQKFSINF